MINLLSDSYKQEIRAARNNVLLVRYILLLVAGAAFLAISLGVAFYYLSSIKANAEHTITENSQKEGSYAKVRAEAEEFRSTLSQAKTILDQQVSYSSAIIAITHLLPPGTALESLKLDSKSFSGPMTLSVKVSGESAAKDLLDRFQASSDVTSVQKGNISVSDDAHYPYTMDLSVTFSKDIAS
jgi:hypothetical protein